MKKINKAAILSIGDELLIGQVVNTNASWLSNQLNLAGFKIERHLSVADDHMEINAGLEQLRSIADIILVTGGLGPTKDDITMAAVAQFFEDELVFHEDTFARLQKIMERFGRTVNDDQKHQCELPSTADVLPNELGTAPCMHFIDAGRHYFFMPGVPHEMRHLFTDRILPILSTDGLISSEIITKTILTAGIGESNLEQLISDIVDSFPEGLSIAYLPGRAQVRLRLTAISLDNETMDHYIKLIEERVGIGVFGHNDQTLESVIGELLMAKGLTLGLAESCTGGAVSAKITSIAGASKYYEGSIISYSYELKNKVLNVSQDTLNQYGAVSEPCVEAMIKGALEVLNVDVAIAISGIAGPGGGTEDKPVGTAYIGVGDGNSMTIKRLTATKSRAVNIEYFTSYALNLLRIFLMK